MSSGKYLMHIQDENKLSKKLIIYGVKQGFRSGNLIATGCQTGIVCVGAEKLA